MQSRLALKIMEEKDGELYPLFHGKGPVPRDTWLHAEQKQVIDGSGGQPYASGFHFLFTMDAVKRYLRKFRKPRRLVIVRCLVRDVRQKPRSEAWLANHIMILETVAPVWVPFGQE